MDIEDDNDQTADTGERDTDLERNELKSMLDEYNYASSVPVKKLPTNLFDLKSLFQVGKSLKNRFLFHL